MQTMPALPALEDHSMVLLQISFLKPLYLVDFPALYLMDLVAHCWPPPLVAHC